MRFKDRETFLDLALGLLGFPARVFDLLEILANRLEIALEGLVLPDQRDQPFVIFFQRARAEIAASFADTILS